MAAEAQVAPKAKRQRKVKQAIEAVPENVEEHAGHSRLARALGSVDWHTREKGMQALTRFLQRKAELPERDMLKIWKGLFYAFWHSDKAPVQEELAERLAAVLSDLQPQVAFMYYTCFVLTMRREWFGIDRLRLDKFLMLMRKFMCRMFKLLADNKWNKALTSQYMDYIRGHVLLPSDSHRALGITYHFADIFIPELKRMVSAALEGGAPAARAVPPAEAVAVLLQPFAQALAAASDAPLLVRIKEGVFDSVLQELRNPDDTDVLRNLDTSALAAGMFDLGAQPGTLSRSREALYGISSALERAKAKRQRTQLEQGAKRGSNGAGAVAAAQAPKHVAAVALADDGVAGASAAGGATGKKKRKAVAMDAAVANGVGPAGQDDAGAGVSGRQGKADGAAAPEAGASRQEVVAAGHARVQEDGAVTPGASGKGKKGKLLAMGGVPGSAQASPAVGPAGGKAGQQGQGQAAAQPQVQAVHAVSALKQQVPKSALKGGKAPGTAADGQVQGRKREASVAFAAAVGESAATTPQGTGKGQKGGASGHKDGTGAGPRTAPPAGAASASAKKRVQINLRKNLYFEFGGPVPPADVRTPQTARAKGGILKASAGAVPRSAPAKSKGNDGATAHRRPKGSSSADKALLGRGPAGSMGKPARARAALFF